MAEKKLLLLETNFDVAQKYKDFLKNSVWKISHKDSLNSFLVSMKEDEFDVAVVEGGIVPDKIISMVLRTKPVIICSDNNPKVDKVTSIPRYFTGSELVNALGKVSFMKVAGKQEDEDDSYMIEETISEDKPVILEPIADNDEEAELLTPEDSGEPVRSSWEIESDGVDIEARTLVDEDDPEPFSEPEVNSEIVEEKQDIFEKIDEIDSIIMSLNKDVDEKKPESVSDPNDFGIKSPESSGKDDNAADFLFDDDYKYEEKNNEDRIGKISDDEDVSSSRVADFESILNDENVKVEEPVELKRTDETEAETVKDYQDSFDGMTDQEKVEKSPFEEAVELTPEEVEENPEEEAVELTPEPVAEPEPVIEPEPEPEVEAESFKVAEKIEEIKNKTPEVEGDVLKIEFRKWLDENARAIVKEVVEEQLKELYSKK